jgi:hypothetical protein
MRPWVQTPKPPKKKKKADGEEKEAYAGTMTQMVKCLSNKHKSRSSNDSTAEGEKKEAIMTI